MRYLSLQEIFNVNGGASTQEKLEGYLGAKVKIISSTPAMWSDSSLGLPTPGEMYAQVITSGAVVCVEANGKQSRYHVSDDFGIAYAGDC